VAHRGVYLLSTDFVFGAQIAIFEPLDIPRYIIGVAIPVIALDAQISTLIAQLHNRLFNTRINNAAQLLVSELILSHINSFFFPQSYYKNDIVKTNCSSREVAPTPKQHAKIEPTA
jgi:hypothetical protein